MHNIKRLKTSLKSIIIVPHAFGHHEYWSSSWCGYLNNTSTYTHNSLPHWKDLLRQELQSDLKQIVDIFVHSANKGAPLGSSQVNWAPNNTIGSKAPKIQHYGSSECNDYRVYVMPKHGISAGSSAVHILFVMNKGLVYNGQPVSTDSLAGGVSKFFDWLKTRKPYTLLAQSGNSFDGKHLIKAG